MLQSAMLNQAVAGITTSASLTLPSTVTSATSDPAASPSMLLQQFISRNVSHEAASSGAQYPSSLGNPASILPFLTAQANSVFSIASGKDNSSAGAVVSVSSSGSSEAGDKGSNPESSGFPVGLDLGNGWKVVGLTSLPDSTNQAQKPSVTESFPATFEGLGSACASAGVSTTSGPSTTTSLLTSSSSCEWKVVGLTSLPNSSTSDVGPATTSLSASTRNTAEGTDLSSRISPSTASLAHSCASGMSQSCEDGDTGGSVVHPALHLPSLMDLAAGKSEWKIAGLTTLPVSAGVLPVSGISKEAISTPVCASSPSILPATSAVDSAQWKVVGLTSLSSPPPPPPAAAVPAPLTPVPVVMAAAAPLMAVPMPSVVMGGDEGWKVVGIVPLPQSEEVSTPSPASCESKNRAQSSDASAVEMEAAQKDTWGSPLMHKGFEKTTDSPAGSKTEPVSHSGSSTPQKHRVSSMLTRNTHNRVWASPPVSKRRSDRDPGHPLSFLKNCSRQFRNTVLKKNTVSTMLELKRAFQTQGEEEKMVTFLGKKKVFTLDKHGHKKELHYQRRHSSNSSCDGETEDPDLLQSAMLPGPDDRAVLADLYRGQTDLQNAGTEPAESGVFEGSTVTSQDSKGRVKAEMSLDSCLRVIKAEDGEEVLSIAGFDSDNVNLTNVDPWGVCTDEDLGEIAEMISDRGGNKISHSSSRKRKLSTPRKMVQ